MIQLIGVLVLIIIFAAHWKLSIIGQSILLHRGATHNQFSFTNKKYIKWAHWYLFFFMGSSYLSPRAYATLHRMHHRYADEDLDPHKPPFKELLGPIKMLLNTSTPYRDSYRRRDFMRIGTNRIDIRGEHDKTIMMEWDAFDRVAHSWPVRLSWVVIYVALYTLLLFAFQMPLWLAPLSILHILMGPIHGMIVNYYGHLYGEQPHEMSNTSRNMHPIVRKVFQLNGELFHNNHHKYPSSPDFSLGKGTDGSFIIMKWLANKKIIAM